MAGKIRLYLDEDAMDGQLVAAIRSYGFDAVTARDANMLNQPDGEHLAWASSARRVLYSFNVRDCQRIHSEWISQGRKHCGVVLVAQRQFSISEQARRLGLMATKVSPTSMRNRIEFLSNWSG